MHAESRPASGVGVPGSLGEQAHRHRRSIGAGARADEPPKRARLAHVARLSVTRIEVAALTVHGFERVGGNVIQQTDG